MTERRFGLLERDGGPEEQEPKEEAPAQPVTRALERDGELGLDESGSARTHFCRECDAEVRDGVRSCYNCGGRIGGPDQQAFDALRRRELAVAEQEKERARDRERVVREARAQVAREREREREAELRRQRRPDPARAPTPGLDPRWQLAVVQVCLFATVSTTLHLFLSAAYADHVPWSVLTEVAIATVATWVVFTALRAPRG